MHPFPVPLLLVLLAGGGEPEATRPGLHAAIFAGREPEGPPVARRHDRSLQFDWATASPDLRLGAGPFAVRWSGYLVPSEDGDHVLHVHVSGRVRIRVDGRTVLEGEATPAAWIAGAPVRLEYGYRRLVVEYASPERGEPASLGVFWESSQFPLEPLASGALEVEAARLPPADFERGLELVHRLGCASCHAIPGVPPPVPAPSLRAAGRELTVNGLRERLGEPVGAAVRSRMPGFELSRAEVEAVVAFLVHSAGALSDTSEEAGRQGERRGREPSLNRVESRRLLLSGGCLACHTLQGLGAGQRFGGGPLELAGRRRDRDALARWLALPQGAGARDVHRPGLPLTDPERRGLAGYLASLVDDPSRDVVAGAVPADPRPDRIARGREIVESRQCGACHELPSAVPGGSGSEHELAGAPPLHRDSEWSRGRGCLLPGVDRDRPHPVYALTETERAAVVAFLAGVAPGATLSHAGEGAMVFEEKGCATCHRRSGSDRLAELVREVVVREPSLRGEEGTLRPPSIAAIGDKLLDDTLSRALAGDQERRRPWLRVRMPRFFHTGREERALQAYLVARDRIPHRPAASSGLPAAAELYAVGHRLLGANGFGCTSCHVLGTYQPTGVAPGVRGPDLVGLAARLRREWFFRWVKDPVRIVPGIEMPAISVAFPDLLDEDLDLQLEAIWHTLNSETFSPPPAAGAVRHLSTLPPGSVTIIHDVFRLRGPFGERWVPRALAIGLENSQSLLYDLDALSPIAWWSDAFASQLTRGKTWLWEIAGLPVLPRLAPLPSVAWRDADRKVRLARRLTTTHGWLRSWRVDRKEVELRYDLHLGEDGWLKVVERISAPFAGESGVSVHAGGGRQRRGGRVGPGVTRSFEVRGESPDGQALLLVALPGGVTARREKGSLEVDVDAGFVRFEGSERAPWAPLTGGVGVEMPHGVRLFARETKTTAGVSRGVIEARWQSRTALVPPPPGPPRGVIRRESRALDLVPGFEGRRLPLDETIMPTGFAFSESGEIFFTNLDGRVRRLLDADGDGIEDSCAVVAENLSAPFGLLVDGRDLLVSHKPELLRLRDVDSDGVFETAEVIATGWGLSHDYHDWTFGLVPRGDGFLVLMGSDYQQRGRPEETTRHRGKAVRIASDGTLEDIARGLRFTVGLAANHEGEVFFTDNQGEGNTFNEINHLRRGRMYGVPALHDPAADRRQAGEPPAIQVPHPWTRSVNGIAFIPRDGDFGPLAGQGVGCEYDNRMLIRFSLQRVGETYQGACYPFSRPRRGDDGFLGPLVCGVGPAGNLWVGNVWDSGWGGGNNVGSIVRLRPTGRWPAGIREVRAHSSGFDIDLSAPCDARRASDPGRYTISAYRRIWKGGYATADQDRHRLPVREVEIAADCRRIHLRVDTLRAGFVHEIHVGPILSDGRDLWPAVAHYTLNVVPAAQTDASSR